MLAQESQWEHRYQRAHSATRDAIHGSGGITGTTEVGRSETGYFRIADKAEMIRDSAPSSSSRITDSTEAIHLSENGLFG
jgi:hypothetical protein